MISLKGKLICERIIILGCSILIAVYLSGILSGIILSKSFFSAFWESTIITLLTIVILFYVTKDYNADLNALEKEKSEKEEQIEEPMKNEN